MTQEKPFNPLDRVSLAASVAEALLSKSPVSMAAVPNFWGAGVYAIYYTGEFEPYKRIADQNNNGKWGLPIYVGKAIPEGGRRGAILNDIYSGNALFKRLKEHAESIYLASSTIKLEDFYCRYLVVEDIWIPLGESLLISKFSPVWNLLVDGFGNHDPGSGRYNGLRPRWDVLHPGRLWAENCRQRPESAETICSEVSDFLRSRYE